MRKSLWPIQTVLVICALLFCLRGAHGDVWKSQDLNCQIDLPSGPDWNPVSPSAAMVKVAIRNQAKREAIALFVVDAPPASQTLETFLPGFKKTYFPESISTKQSENFLTIDGRSASILGDTVELQGQLIRRGTLVVLDGGRVYQVGVTSLSGNPLDDPELQKSFQSFHFLAVNSAPPAWHPVRLDPAKLPQIIGRITGFVLIAIVTIALLIKAIRRN